MKRFAAFLLITTIVSGTRSALAELKGEVMIPRTVYQPFFKEEGEGERPIGPLKMDRVPVTNRQFREFIKANPQWRKSSAKRVFVASKYLEHWSGGLRFDAKIADHPVVNVGWFAARAYCESRGQRLPTLAEWEAVADGQNPRTLEDVLHWYSRPSGELRPVGQSDSGKFGLKDMHGLIWEWIEDFSSVIIVGDSRSSNDPNEARFCGSGSLQAKDPNEYATFMRFAFRSSLKAKSEIGTLGFRCVRDLKER